MKTIQIFRVVLDLQRNQKEKLKFSRKIKKADVKKEFPSLKNRCSSGLLLGVIQGLSREQKDCVRAMGFGSLLGMKMIDVLLKIVYYVLDHFDFESLKVEFDNCQISVDSKSVQEMLGLPSGGSLLSNMDYISENKEESCMFEWKKQYENIDKLRLKQLKNELVQTSAADDNFRINFLVLFINTLCESTSMGKCNLNPLDTDLSNINWYDYIVDCLVRTKKVNNPEKESSLFYGPTTYLMVRVVLGVLTASFGVTAYSLPRDQIGYWAVKIVTGVPEAIPIIGSPLVELLPGSASVGQSTLTRFYSLRTGGKGGTKLN
uniref:Cytochrome b/b6 N-terminal region profile domain-containing protein n=1 Tax=Lactuca sativa TaxID=4236 RepID=A0A9R1XA12_LACSA|nr:hypothetical protein LSAT_V11C500263610 [Lactuca sativa]